MFLPLTLVVLMNSMTDSKSNIVPFKYVGRYIEELIELAYERDGFVAFSMSDAGKYLVNVRMGENVLFSSGDTLFKATRSMLKVMKSQLGAS